MKPYYEDEYVQLFHGDHRVVLPALGLTFDLIVADPPYGETSLKWDRWPQGWPSGMSAYSRSMWCFGSMRMFLDRRSEFDPWKLSQDIVWEKHNGSGPGLMDRFYRVHEHVTHWYIGRWSEVHHAVPRTSHDGPNRTWRSSSGEHAARSAHRGAIGERDGYRDDGTRQARSVLKCRSEHQRGTVNDTQKPIGLLEPLIAYGCPVGGLVLDPFAGSASTLAAARATGRRAVGIELREEQCEKAAQRLAHAPLDFGAVS